MMKHLLELATARKWYTEVDLGLAFVDGIAAGIAAQKGTFGTEDFMKDASLQTIAFLSSVGCPTPTYPLGPRDWQDVWRAVGGSDVLDQKDLETPLIFYKIRLWIRRWMDVHL
jgi:hypothetical protein